ncbi:MAG: RNA methyltransferase [Ruminococcus sp.]|nr:RNA methyltransferase [Ruminococcus sp.]
MEITSIDNKRVKYWLKLKDKKYRDIENKFLVEGDHLVHYALNAGLVEEIIAIDNTCEKEGIPFYLVNDSIMKKLTSQVTISKVVAVCNKIPNNKITDKVLILDNIQDPGNLGTIIRSALAFNFKTIILSHDTVDLYNEKVIRASEGMLFNLNFLKGNLEEILDDLKAQDYKIFGTDVKNGTILKDVNIPNKLGVIIGNEGKGMHPNLKEYCDTLINIPLNKTCESLNAGVAASVIMYEINR